MIQNAYSKIDAEFAVNEGSAALDIRDGTRMFQIHTFGKIPTRVTLTARGTAGHGSLPRPGNPVVHLARAIERLADAGQPIRLNTTTRRYFNEIAKLPDYAWLAPFLSKLDDATAATAAANEIRARRGTERHASYHRVAYDAAGREQSKCHSKYGANETRQEVEMRFRAIINDPAGEVGREPGQDMPPRNRVR
jgi:hypothetical protein